MDVKITKLMIYTIDNETNMAWPGFQMIGIPDEEGQKYIDAGQAEEIKVKPPKKPGKKEIDYGENFS
jgi:hypothetical protein